MARSLRNDPTGAWHHVMNRGARHQPIYFDDRDRRRFLGLLEDLHREERIETHAYCLMGNHYHLLLFCPDGNLSVGMHDLASRYAQRFNRRHGFDGPLFRGRFLSKPIETDEYLLQVSRYVHRNPLDLDPAADPAAYPWSSYAAYVGHRRPPTWLRCSMVLGVVGGDAASYRSYVETEGPSLAGAPHPPDPGLIVAIEAAVKTAARSWTGPPVEGRGSRTIVRNVALLFAIEEHRFAADTLARHYGFAGAASVWSAVRRTRVRAQDEVALAAFLHACRPVASAIPA